MGKREFDKLDLQTVTLNTTPLYIQVRDKLIERIRCLIWRPGIPLPNELALANEFRVSIGTIRKAMDDLSSLGLIVRHQGRGTFVAEYSGTAGASLLDHVRRHDGAAIVWDPPRTYVTVEPAGRQEEVAFGWLASSAPLLKFEWVLGAAGRRIVLQKTSVPVELVEISVKHAKHISSLGELFQQAKILLDRAEIALFVAPASPEIAQRLSVPPGTCLQRLQRRLFDLQGKSVAISDDWLALKDEVSAYVQPRT